LNDTEIRIKKVREELTSIESDQINWVKEWGQAIDGLGLKPDVHPEKATEAFDHLMEFFDKFDKSEELRKRVSGMDQVAEKFEKKVFEFADSIGFPREGQEASTIAAHRGR